MGKGDQELYLEVTMYHISTSKARDYLFYLSKIDVTFKLPLDLECITIVFDSMVILKKYDTFTTSYNSCTTLTIFF
jgi:hypothetical protein